MQLLPTIKIWLHVSNNTSTFLELRKPIGHIFSSVKYCFRSYVKASYSDFLFKFDFHLILSFVANFLFKFDFQALFPNSYSNANSKLRFRIIILYLIQGLVSHFWHKFDFKPWVPIFLFEIKFKAWFPNSCSNWNSRIHFQNFTRITSLFYDFSFEYECWKGALNSNSKKKSET